MERIETVQSMESIYKFLSHQLYSGRDPYSPWKGISSFPTEVRYPHTNITLEVIDEVLERSPTSFWLEVGSMYGGSAIKAGSRIKELSLPTEIICIDPFCGDSNMWEWTHLLRNSPGSGYGFCFLDQETIRPTILEKFLGNVIESNLQKMILPIPVTGIVGMRLIERFIEDNKIKEGPGIIYLDSAHELDETYLEMKIAWRLLKNGGILFGDDIAWVAVRHDLYKFSAEIGIPFEVRKGGHWILQKPIDYPHIPSPLLEHLDNFNRDIFLEEDFKEEFEIKRETINKKETNGKMKSYGDYETDLAIQKYFDPEYVGTCIDIGAGMGTERSNTYYFEKKYWTCLCIEPNPNLYNHMRMYRRIALNLACSNYDEKSVPFHVYVVNENNQEAISSLVVDQRLIESHKEIINKTYEINVEVKKLDTILSRINIEKIDFLSIDTEGTELSVLQGLDLKKWSPKLIVVENNFNDTMVKEYLSQFGYILSERLGVNDFYLKSDAKPVVENTKTNLDLIFEI